PIFLYRARRERAGKPPGLRQMRRWARSGGRGCSGTAATRPLSIATDSSAQEVIQETDHKPALKIPITRPRQSRLPNAHGSYQPARALGQGAIESAFDIRAKTRIGERTERQPPERLVLGRVQPNRRLTCYVDEEIELYGKPLAGGVGEVEQERACRLDGKS